MKRIHALLADEDAFTAWLRDAAAHGRTFRARDGFGCALHAYLIRETPHIFVSAGQVQDARNGNALCWLPPRHQRLVHQIDAQHEYGTVIPAREALRMWEDAG
jgi:hypothetical protein